ncbi:MAG: DUF2281 domain-containing protein [Chloroflexota bacterium]
MMTIETAVLTRLRRLPAAQQQEVLHFVEFLETKTDRGGNDKSAQLAAAAQSLLVDYESDADLTTFTALDGEDFHA